MRDGPEESKQGDEEEDHEEAWLCLMSTHHLFVAFSNSARFEIRKLQTFQGIRSSILLLPLTFLVVAKGPTICRKLHT